MTETTMKWWDDNAINFQEDYKVPIDISYGPGMPNEDKLKLLGDLKKKKVLEIGCGGAQCGVSFAKEGAEVIGIDISKEQLKYAKELANKNNVEIELLQGEMENLEKIESNSQDIVFSSWALFYVSNLKKCFEEVFRVLRKGGIFVFSTYHPSWKTINKENMRVERGYFETGSYKLNYKKGTYEWYATTISELINSLINVGFIIERVEEPDIRKKEMNISNEVIPKESTRKLMRLIPRAIIFKARKMKNA